MKKALLAAWIVTLLHAAASFAGEGREAGIVSRRPADRARQLTAPLLVAGDETDRKLDPMLRYVLNRTAKGGSSSAVRSAVQSLESIAAIGIAPGGQPEVGVFVKTEGPTGDAVKLIGAAGGRTDTIAGNVLSARVPLSGVRGLAARPEVHSLQLASMSRPLLNSSRVESGVSGVHNGNGLPQPYTGDGVVVGVVDTGIDWSHPDFDNPSNKTRIRYLWDMSGSGPPPPGQDYGTLCTKAHIDASNCPEIDGDGGAGHGTHVAGTAAGAGHVNTAYRGMAPDADIVFVKGMRSHDSSGGFSDTDVVNGVGYIFSKAQSLGEPAAVNLSLGGHLGPHDGTSLYEQAIDNLTGAGRVIVIAGGNQGGDIIHGGYATDPGTSYDNALETVFYSTETSSIMAIDLWYPTGSITVGVALYTLAGELLGYTNPVAPGQAINELATDFGIISIDATTTNDPQNNDKRVLVVIDSSNGTLPMGAVFWSLYTYSASGHPAFDMWMVTGGAFTIDSQQWFRPGDSEKTLGIPGTARKAITIGSYVTKNQWVDIDGLTQQQVNPGPTIPTVGQLSYFSSRGPTRDARLKPEITAPGEAILAPMSSHLTIGVGVQRQDILLNGGYRKLQGTSMASPHVTGVVALMLQRNPGLTPEEARTILQETARTDGFTGATPNYLWGFGRLGALSAVQAVTSVTTTTVLVTTTTMPVTTTTIDPICGECGDVNGDEQVRATDALMVLRKAVGQDVALICGP